MTLREVTRTIIKRVEDVSGCPVIVREDASLKTLAASRIARGPNRIHLISFKPSAVSEPDYLICYQCGFILRLFATPAADRFDLVGTVEGRQLAFQLLTAPDGPAMKLNLPPESISALSNHLFDGLMTQLRSIPSGLRVDSWIMGEFPELSELQQNSAMQQLQDNLQVLSPEIKKLAPTKIFRAILTMNAAFAEFWARHRSDPRLSLPYKAAGFAKAAEELLRALDENPADPSGDCRLIDLWSKHLGLSGWYQWRPYDAPGHS